MGIITYLLCNKYDTSFTFTYVKILTSLTKTFYNRKKATCGLADCLKKNGIFLILFISHYGEEAP